MAPIVSSSRWLRFALGVSIALTSLPSARALDPKIPLNQLASRTWGRREGLPSNTVRALARTEDGMLWLGTDQGLVAFDGVSFERFRVADVPELPADAIVDLVAIGKRLWIGTQSGLARWEDGVFSRITAADGFAETQIVSLVRLPIGLVVGAYHAPYVLRGERFEPLRGSPGGAPVRHACNGFGQRPDGALLLACDELITWRDDQVIDTIALSGGAEKVSVDDEGTVWVGLRHDGVGRLSEGKLELVVSRADGITALYVDHHGSLWIGGSGPGLQRRTHDGVVDELTLPGDVHPSGIAAISEAPDGSIFFGSFNAGLVQLSQGAFRVIDERSGAPTNLLSVYEDRAGTVWMAGADDPTLVSVRGRDVQRFPMTLPALAHLETPEGVHYVGTPSGVLRRDGDAFVALDFSHSELVAWLGEGPDAAMWLAMPSFGLMRLVGGVSTLLSREGGKMIRSTSLLASADGRSLWVGTDHDVCRVDTRDPALPVTCFGEAQGMPSGLVLGLHEDAAGSLWAGTFDKGLVRLRDGHAVALTQHQGLIHDSHYAVFEDAAGRLWLPGPSGIVRIPRAELDALADGRIASVHARLFDSADGLPADETNGGGMCCSQTKDGRLWFPTPAGAAMIDPNTPDPIVTSPPTLITELRIGERALARAGGVAASDERDLLVRFTAPTLVHGADVHFRYRMDDIDEDWVDAGTRRLAMYTELPPGPHVFHVAARAVGASEFGPAATFTVERAAAFDETVGFRVLVAGAIVLLLYLGYRLRIARLLANEAQLARLVEARTHELEVAKGELEHMNVNLAQRVDEAVDKLRGAERMAAYGHTVAGVAHEVRQPLFALGTTAYVLGDKLRDRPDVQRDIQLLERETKRMNRVMDELLDFAKPTGLMLGACAVSSLLADAVEVFRAEHDPESKVPLALEADVRDTLPLDAGRMQQVLVNLLHNAQKHAVGMTQLTLRAAHDGPTRVVIDVIDDGRGISPDTLPHIFEPFFTTGGTGLGLAIARRIVEDHGATLEVASSASGTRFRIVFRIAGESHAA